MCRIVFNYKGKELFWRAFQDDPIPRVGEFVAYKDKIYQVNTILYHYDKRKIGINLVDYPIN